METATFEIIADKAIIHLSQNIDFNNLVAVEKVFSALFEKKPALIAINCNLLRFIDSTAIAFFVNIAAKAKGLNIKLVFYNLNEELRYTFAIIKMDRIIPTVTQEEIKEEFSININ